MEHIFGDLQFLRVGKQKLLLVWAFRLMFLKRDCLAKRGEFLVIYELQRHEPLNRVRKTAPALRRVSSPSSQLRGGVPRRG